MLWGADPHTEVRLPTQFSLVVRWVSNSTHYPRVVGKIVSLMCVGCLAHSHYYSGINCYYCYPRVCSLRRDRSETGVCLTCWREVRGRGEGGGVTGEGWSEEKIVSPLPSPFSSGRDGMGWDESEVRGSCLCPAHPPALSGA